MHRVDYYESICGLLHDIGKPFLRYKWRVNKGLEPGDSELDSIISSLDNHVEISGKIMRDLNIDPDRCKFFEESLKLADHLAAAERGFGKYQWLRDKWGEIVKCISSKTGIELEHYLTPLLSPLWMTVITDYSESLGPCSEKPYTADEALVKLYNEINPIVNALNQVSIEDICNKVASLLNRLKEEKLWFPVKSLTSDVILKELEPLNYSEALKRIDYREVSKKTYESLVTLVKQLYGNKLTRGLVDSLNEVLKYTLSTVPSAVYNVFLPDINLYSHSKLVAAYSSILSITKDINTWFKLLVLDARRIQDFVASPVVAKAASRVIRGRSFLVELVSLSLVNYILELYGELPYTNVLTLEGGSLTILVPAFSKNIEEDIKRNLESVIKSTFNKLKGLWFTIALSKEFNLEDVDYTTGLSSCRKEDRLICKLFFEVLESLEKNIAIEKTLDESKSIMEISQDKIHGFDAITKEPVTEEEVYNGYGLTIDRHYLEYGGIVSGGKLEEGDVISEATHLSLVAGSCLRNLVFLISTYVYERKDELTYPAGDRIDQLTKSIREYLYKRLEKKPECPEQLCKQLYFSEVPFREYGVNIGIIPLKTLGALHIMISFVAPKYPEMVAKPTKSGIELARDIAENVVSDLISELSKKLEEFTKNGFQVRLETRVVNTGLEYVELSKTNIFSKTIKDVINKNIDFYLGVLYTGTHHPFEKTNGITLVDLDVYNFISLVKADIDNLGEVRKLMSFSPSRLTSLSDFLTMIVTGKTHLLALDYSEKYITKGPRGPILLYAGGDDVTFYGYWVDTLLFLSRFYDKIVKTLYPLTFTSSIVIEHSDYPLLELYRKVVFRLSEIKSTARGGIFIDEISSPRVSICNSDKVKLTNSLKPFDDNIYAKGFGSTLPTEVFYNLTKILEKLEENQVDKEKINSYRRELMILSRIASLTDREIKSIDLVLTQPSQVDLEILYSLTRRSVALSYISARREEDFRKLSELISGLIGQNIVLHHVTGENVFEALRRLVNSKTFIDILLFYLHPFSTVIKSTT